MKPREGASDSICEALGVLTELGVDNGSPDVDDGDDDGVETGDGVTGDGVPALMAAAWA